MGEWHDNEGDAEHGRPRHGDPGTGHRLTGFDAGDREVRAYFATPDGTALDPVRGDILVAADGIHSAVRAALFPDGGPPRWNGVTMWHGCADWPVFGT